MDAADAAGGDLGADVDGEGEVAGPDLRLLVLLDGFFGGNARLP